MNKKMNLENLVVESFVTAGKDRIMGGATGLWCTEQCSLKDCTLGCPSAGLPQCTLDPILCEPR